MRVWIAMIGCLTIEMGAAQATTLTTLVSFTGTGTTISGANSQASLLLDANGNLFGTTLNGGTANRGIVFELAKGSTKYTYSTLLSFTGNNGSAPFSDVVSDSSGNLYGTTAYGGAVTDGNVFKLTKGASSYTVSTLATFTGSGNGSSPVTGLIADGSGDLFGTTNGGGANGWGTVFELVKGSSTYTTTTIATFSSATGGDPFGKLVADSSGNLFGTTNVGGPGNNGTVFELVKGTSGYALNTLASFNVTNGANPYGGLLLDSSGNLFGTTYDGGANNAGTAFELTKAAGYALSTIATFTAANGYVDGGLIEDAAGNLFGTTLGAVLKGGGSNQGMVYELARSASDYTLNTLISFNGAGNGASPYDSLIADSNGNLFGTTSAGGSGGKGTVFEVVGSGFITNATAVAEPSSLSLLALGILGALVRKRI